MVFIMNRCKKCGISVADESNVCPLCGMVLTNDGELAFRSGASATITGNMLTTAACATIRTDRKLLEDMGRDVTPEYWKQK